MSKSIIFKSDGAFELVSALEGMRMDIDVLTVEYQKKKIKQLFAFAEDPDRHGAEWVPQEDHGREGCKALQNADQGFVGPGLCLFSCHFEIS